MSDPQLARVAKAIHTLFWGTERAAARRTELEESLEGDEEIAAFQALGVGLINFEPLSPAQLERARERFAALERETPKVPSERISIEVNNDTDARYAKRLLERMYARWEGTLDYEPGKHRFVFYSQTDEECRRHTVFAQVSVDGYCPDLSARSYVLGPYLLVKDERTGRESSDPWAILAGDLTPVLPEAVA